MALKPRSATRLAVTVSSLGAVVLAAVALCATAVAKARKPVAVKRCGYARITGYGRTAIYPWKTSCAAARGIVEASTDSHLPTIAFGPGWDGAAVRINGRYWVCTGQMGFYNCGYPYRPKKVQGEQGYAGPFTEDIEFEACSLTGGTGCGPSFEFLQPQS
jgi:hypothetical protein